MFKQVIDFWFSELNQNQWFAKNPDLDEMISLRFGDLVEKARTGELFEWRAKPEGRLAEVILIDQFSRNIFRDAPESFSADTVSLVLAQESVSQGLDQQLPTEMRAFLYMPYMHSESKTIHAIAVGLFNQPGLEKNLAFEYQHKAIIDRFGRYPHRNEILGRQSTTEEIAFLEQSGSSF